MPDTYSNYLNLTKPEPGTSGWDAKLNATLDKIDAGIARQRNKVQTVLSGALAAGVPKFMLGGVGQGFTVQGSVKNLILSFSDGINEYVYAETDDVGVAVDPDVIGYVIAEYDANNHTVSYGVTIDSNTVTHSMQEPASPSDADLWFSVHEMKMYERVAGAWVQKLKLVIGRYYNGGGTTFCFSSSFNGVFISPVFSIVGGTTYSYSHQLNAGNKDIFVMAYGIPSTGDRDLCEFEKIYATNGAVLMLTADGNGDVVNWNTVKLKTFTSPSIVRNGIRVSAGEAVIIAQRVW